LAARNQAGIFSSIEKAAANRPELTHRSNRGAMKRAGHGDL
jgi:hypothetical protein